MTTRLVTANVDFATGDRKDRTALRRLAGLPVRLARAIRRKRLPDTDPSVVLMLQEAKTGRMADLLGGLFRGLQGRGAARSGTALLSRGIRLRGLRLWLGGDSTQTLPRWVTRGHVRVPELERTRHGWRELDKVRRLVCMSVHIFPKRAGRDAQLRYVRKLARKLARIENRGHAWAVGVDANMDLDAFARLLGGVAHHHGDIVGVVTSRNVVVSKAGTSKVGLRLGAFDHPSKWVDVEGVR